MSKLNLAIFSAWIISNSGLNNDLTKHWTLIWKLCKERREKNYIKENLNKVIFDKPDKKSAPKSVDEKFQHKN